MKNGENSFGKLQLRYFASYVAIMLIVMIALISSLFGFRCMYSEIITAISSEARASGVNEEELRCR